MPLLSGDIQCLLCLKIFPILTQREDDWPFICDRALCPIPNEISPNYDPKDEIIEGIGLSENELDEIVECEIAIAEGERLTPEQEVEAEKEWKEYYAAHPDQDPFELG